MAAHGTIARYKQHKKDREKACEACLKANAQYNPGLFARNPQAHADENARKRATGRAMTRLRNLHPMDYELIYQQELRREFGDGQRNSQSAG